MEERKDIPLGVRILAIFLYCFSPLFLLASFFLFFISKMIINFLLEANIFLKEGSFLVSNLSIFAAIIFFLGVFYFFLARGLFRARPLARPLSILLFLGNSFVSILFILRGIFLELFIFIIIINLSFLIYFLFSKKVKEFFQ